MGKFKRQTRKRNAEWKNGRRGQIQSVKKRIVSQQIYSSKDDLVIGALNTDGLTLTTLYDVTDTLKRKKIDICFLLETKRRLGEIRHEIDIDGYSVFEIRRSDEAGDRDGGGIAVYTRVKDGILFKRYDPEITDRDLISITKERQWVVVKSETRKTAVCGLYMGCNRPDNKYAELNEKIYTQVLREIVSLRRDGHRIVLVGDFNSHVGNRLGEGVPGNHPSINFNGRRFLEFIKAADLVHTNGATRIPGDWESRISKGMWTWNRNGVRTILDYGLVGNENIDTLISFEVDELGNLGGDADHNFIILKVTDNFTKQTRKARVEKEKEVWNISEETDWKPFTEYVNKMVGTEDRTTMTRFANCLSGWIIRGLKEVFGTRKIFTKTNSVALPRSIVQELRKRRELETRYKTVRQEAMNREGEIEYIPASVVKAKQMYKDQQERVEDLITKFKSMRRKEKKYKCTGNSPKARREFWRVASNKDRKATEITALIDPKSGILKCKEAELVEIVEDYVKNIFKGEFTRIKHTEFTLLDEDQSEENQGKLYHSRRDKEHIHSYSKQKSKIESIDNSKTVKTDPLGYGDNDITVEEVQNVVKELKNNKAAGWDKIPNEAIVHAGKGFIELLTELYNIIFTTGEMPSNWKHGRLVLIHKKDLVEDIYNYRPLTVIIALCGLYSKVLNERLTNITEEHDILGEIQNGFRKGRSCADNKLILSTILWKAKAQRRNAHAGYVDLEKAYDTVDRDELWSKMKKLGFGKKFINGIKAMYQDDCTSTSIGGKQTRKIYQRRGLRQGCSLSPLLFAIYMADLGEMLSESGIGFKIMNITVPGLFLADDLVLVAQTTAGLKTLLEITQVWCVRNKMKISVKKTKIISPEEENWDLLDDQGAVAMTLERVEHYRYLGSEMFQSMYKAGTTKQQEAVNTAYKYKCSCMRVSYAGPDRMELALCCWQSIAMSSIRFGTEIIPFTEQTFTELDRVQSQLAKWILGLPQGAANICAQAALGLRYVKHMIYLEKLKYYWRVLHMPENRWAHKALREHMEGGWNSLYLKDIRKIRNEVGMTLIPNDIKTIKMHLDQHFVEVANKKLQSLVLPEVQRVKEFGQKPRISEDDGMKWCYMFQYRSAPIGHRTPRPGYTRKKDCPLCAHKVELTEIHLFSCGSLVGIRRELGIATFLSVCLSKGLPLQEGYRKFIRGGKLDGGFVELYEQIERGNALKVLVETFLSMW